MSSVFKSLLNAVIAGDCRELSVVLEEAGGADHLKGVDKAGNTLLHVASELGKLDVVKFLLEKEVDVNAANEKSGNTALILAVQRGNAAVVKELLNDPWIDVDIQNNAGYSALIMAAATGQLEMSDLLLSDRLYVNLRDKNGGTALAWAAYNGLCPLVHSLMYSEDFELANEDGATPLALAASQGRDEVVKLLLESGANVNKPDTLGNTPLYDAAYGASVRCVELLLDAGAAVNHLNNEKETPLFGAARCKWGNQAEIARLLLERGATTNLRNASNSTVLTVAKRRKLADLVQLLQEHSKADLAECTRVPKHGVKKVGSGAKEPPPVSNTSPPAHVLCSVACGAAAAHSGAREVHSRRADAPSPSQAKRSAARNLDDIESFTTPDRALFTLAASSAAASAASTTASRKRTRDNSVLQGADVRTDKRAKAGGPNVQFPASEAAGTRTSTTVAGTPASRSAPQWLSNHLRALNITEQWITLCEDRLVLQEGFGTEEVFAYTSPEFLSLPYLQGLGITGGGIMHTIKYVHDIVRGKAGTWAGAETTSVAAAPVAGAARNSDAQREHETTAVVPSTNRNCADHASSIYDERHECDNQDTDNADIRDCDDDVRAEQCLADSAAFVKSSKSTDSASLNSDYSSFNESWAVPSGMVSEGDAADAQESEGAASQHSDRSDTGSDGCDGRAGSSDVSEGSSSSDGSEKGVSVETSGGDGCTNEAAAEVQNPADGGAAQCSECSDGSEEGSADGSGGGDGDGSDPQSSEHWLTFSSSSSDVVGILDGEALAAKQVQDEEDAMSHDSCTTDNAELATVVNASDERAAPTGGSRDMAPKERMSIREQVRLIRDGRLT